MQYGSIYGHGAYLGPDFTADYLHREAIEMVKRLASEGADVALTYSSSPDRASEVVKAAQALGVQSLAIHADSADASGSCRTRTHSGGTGRP